MGRRWEVSARWFRTALAATAAVVLAGCGGGTVTASHTATPTSSPTSAATPTATTPGDETSSPSPSVASASASSSVAGAMTQVAQPKHPANSAVPTAGSPLTDGDYFGYLSSIDVGTRQVRVDFAQWLSGDAADKAAVEDGVIAPGEHVDNDYYIRNQSKTVWTVPLGDPVVVTVARCPTSCGQYAGTLQGLADSLRSSDTQPGLSDPYRGRYTVYWLRVQDRHVVRIDEQYRP